MTRLIDALARDLQIPLTATRLAGYVIGTAAALWVIWGLLVVVIVLGTPVQ